MSVRVRFAPSPTGHVHIGNIRAAIFNWLFARHEGGTFLLRIEDTDRERSTPEAVHTLLETMDWLRLDYDEPALYQSTQAEVHAAAAARLEQAGRAYRLPPGENGGPGALCFRIPLELPPAICETRGPAEMEVHPDEPVSISHAGVRYALVSKKGKPVQESGCLAGFLDLRVKDAGGRVLFEAAAARDRLAAGETIVCERAVRLEYTRREVVFTDLVKGRLAKPLEGVKDLVIVRSDGSPVFHLANVCDDSTQRVTHIIRGDDHVENTFRHLLLFDALGAAPPRYAHLPMIVNAQGRPYSKRDGDAYVGDFRARGFDPDALFNALALLGWSPGDDREKLSRAELIEAFTLDRVRSSPSQMDLRKLTHMNNRYLNEVPPEEFARQALLAARHQPWGADVDEALFARVCALMQSRTTVYADVALWTCFFTEDWETDAKGQRKFLQQPGMADTLSALRDRLADVAFEPDALEGALRTLERERGLDAGGLNQPVRVAVTGSLVGAGLYETLELIGRERVLARLERALPRCLPPPG